MAFTAAEALPTGRSEAETELGRRRAALAVRLARFGPRSDDVEIRIPSRPVMALINTISGPRAAPTAYGISLSTADAQGVIARADLLKDDNLGDVGVTITPQNPVFLSGSVAASVIDPKWEAGAGLRSSVKADIRATAAVHYHVSTGKFGGGKGGDTTLVGSSSGSIPVGLGIALARTVAGDAIVLQPEVGCSRIEVDVYSQAALVEFGWIKIGRLGVRIKRNVGGGRQTPAPLVDSLPQIYGIRTEQEMPGTVDELHLAHPAVAATWNLKSVLVEETGIGIVTGLSVAASDAESGHVSMLAEKRLREALSSAAPVNSCDADQQFALLVDRIEIGPGGEIVRLLDETVKAGVRVAQKTVDQIEKLRAKPLKTMGDVPANVGKGAAKAAKWIGHRTSIHLGHH